MESRVKAGDPDSSNRMALLKLHLAVGELQTATISAKGLQKWGSQFLLEDFAADAVDAGNFARAEAIAKIPPTADE